MKEKKEQGGKMNEVEKEIQKLIETTFEMENELNKLVLGN